LHIVLGRGLVPDRKGRNVGC